MLKRLELSTPNSCLNKASPEELIFVLRAKDPLSSMTVRHWATMAEGTHEPSKIEEALRWAAQADKWRDTNFPPAPTAG